MKETALYMIRKCGILLFIGISMSVLGYGCKADVAETMTDIDGNVYLTVKIGTQVWMAENLKVTKYRNGDLISQVKDNVQWINSTSGAWCIYGDEPVNAGSYGLLYNWFAVSDKRDLSPKGWRVPTNEDIEILMGFLGGDVVAGGKMRKAGMNQWLFPNLGATNESGFSALPGGYRFNYESNHPLRNDEGGTFHTLGGNGYWWTAHQSFQLYSWSERLFWGFADVKRDPSYANFGFAVRLIKE